MLQSMGSEKGGHKFGTCLFSALLHVVKQNIFLTIYKCALQSVNFVTGS